LTKDLVHTIARIALFNIMDEREVTDLLRCFSLGRLRAQIVGLGLCESDVDDRELARLYFSGRCRMISPNEFFDEVWYVEHYPDVAGALRAQGLISGFIHFIKHGMRLGLWPNKVLFSQAQACAVPGVPKTAIDEADYLSRYPAAAAFIAAFPMLGALEHYNLYGRFLGFFPDTKPARPAEALSLRVAEAEFDPAFYVARYLTDPEDRAYHQNPFEHYVKFGMRAAYSPNSWFDEQWYRAFYKEVREGIENGWLPSGFYHYILTGRIEGRLPKHDLTAALELRMPGVTDPALMGRTEMLKKRLAGLRSLPLRSGPDHMDPSADAEPGHHVWGLQGCHRPDLRAASGRQVRGAGVSGRRSQCALFPLEREIPRRQKRVLDNPDFGPGGIQPQGNRRQRSFHGLHRLGPRRLRPARRPDRQSDAASARAGI
jgi:hypothetical protein